jgi:hypothetical protein
MCARLLLLRVRAMSERRRAHWLRRAQQRRCEAPPLRQRSAAVAGWAVPLAAPVEAGALDKLREEAWRLVHGANERRLFEQKEQLFEQKEQDWGREKDELEQRARAASVEKQEAITRFEQQEAMLAEQRATVENLKAEYRRKLSQIDDEATRKRSSAEGGAAASLRASSETACSTIAPSSIACGTACATAASAPSSSARSVASPRRAAAAAATRSSTSCASAARFEAPRAARRR